MQIERRVQKSGWKLWWEGNAFIRWDNSLLNIYKCEWWSLYEGDDLAKNHPSENSPTNVLWVTKNSCKELPVGDIEVAEQLENFLRFLRKL